MLHKGNYPFSVDLDLLQLCSDGCYMKNIDGRTKQMKEFQFLLNFYLQDLRMNLK